MKKKLLTLVFSLWICAFSYAQVTINEVGGWMESAFIKWAPVANASSYNVYYTGNGLNNQKIDDQLIRSYGTYFRADILGIAAGTYTITVKPVISGVEGTGATSADIAVKAHDRTGFAFEGGRVPGGYSSNGTPKSGAIILYITENSKNTVNYNVNTSSKGVVINCTGLQNILYAIKKGYETRPFIFRLIGNITDMTVMEGGDVVIENANNAASYITFEGVGSDAVANGWGVRLKSASNIEVRNLGFMNCNSTAGDNVGMQQDNDHIWVHHTDQFYGNAGSDADQIKGDGALDNKTSTYCTFSYNHFWDVGKCSLLGLSEGTTSGLYVTYHHNWFDHSDSRHPRVRYYSAHVYNNYFDGNSKYGIGSTMGSSVFVENNYFRDCKHPMMISLQGTDIASGTANATFSGEAGGIIKSFNNRMDADNGKNDMAFVPYSTNNIQFDAYDAATRGTQVPSTVISYSVGNMYNNFDIDASLYVKTLVPDDPDLAKNNVIAYSGRMNGGDLKFTYDNNIDDAAYLVNTIEKTAVTNYTTTLVAVQGDGSAPIINTQTLTTPTNNSQIVANGDAISAIVFTWGGDATDATVTGIPAAELVYTKNTSAKTITITGNPTGTVTYSIVTTGILGTPVTSTGTISTSTAQLLTTPLNASQTVALTNAISTIIFKWGGVASDANVTGLPASGLDFVKDAIAKTITITGTPTATVSYSIATTGATGTSVTGSGIITVSTTPITTGDEVHNFTLSDKTSTFYTFGSTANLSTSKGTETYNGLTLTQCLKIESATTFSFITTFSSTFTMVFNSTFTGTILVDAKSTSATAGIASVKLAAGTHTVTKGSSANLYYMSVVYDAINTSLPTLITTDLIVYPNPVTNILYISTNTNVEKIEIYSISGVMVKTERTSSKTIDMSNLSKGSYLVKVFTNKGILNQIVIKNE